MTQFIKKAGPGLAALIFVISVGVAGVPVLAIEDDGSEPETSPTLSHDPKKRYKVDGADDNKVRTLVDNFKQRAQDSNTDERKKQVSDRTADGRKRVCENRKRSIDVRIDRTVQFATKHKELFDKIYARVKAYVSDKGLIVPDYDNLIAKVDAAQADAANKLAALQALDPEIDCTQERVADGLSAYREALKDMRDSLKNYRAALGDLIKAVHDAKKASDNS